MAVTAFKNVRDNKAGTLVAAVTAAQLTITLGTGQGASFPAAPFYCSCDYEVMLCTAKAGDILTVTRGVDNTVAAIHASGSVVEIRPVAALWTDVNAAVNALENGTNPAGVVADNSVTSAKIVDGTIVDADINATAAIAATKLAAGITNAQLGIDVARANQLVNGGFEVSQRGTGFNVNGYTADRWLLAIGAGFAGGINTLQTAQVDVNSVYSALFTTTVLGAPVPYIYQKIENGQIFKGQTVSVSLRVYQATANAIQLSINDGIGAYTAALNPTTGGWVTLTLTQTLAVNATQLLVIITALQTGNHYIDNAMLVPGNVAAAFVPIPLIDDLVRCSRYYEVIGVASGSDLSILGIATAGAQVADLQFNFRAIKPVAPTITKVGTWALTNAAGQPTVQGNSVSAFFIEIAATAAGQFYSRNSAGNLTAEANP